MLVDLRGSILEGDDHRGLAERVYRCSGARAGGRGDPGRKRSGFSSTGRASLLLLLLEQQEEEEKTLPLHPALGSPVAARWLLRVDVATSCPQIKIKTKTICSSEKAHVNHEDRVEGSGQTGRVHGRHPRHLPPPLHLHQHPTLPLPHAQGHH